MRSINLWHCEIKTDHPNSAIRPDIALINKKKITGLLVDFCRSSELQSENKRQ